MVAYCASNWDACSLQHDASVICISRGTLHRRKQNFVDAMDDYLTAMDKCGHQQDLPVYRHASRQLVLTYNDFALSCFRKKNFDEAILLLNKAIKEEKREKGLYVNRGGKCLS